MNNSATRCLTGRKRKADKARRIDSVITLSVPELVTPSKVLMPPLIAGLIAEVGTGILLVGYIFNF
jgi:hypothetical protein